MVEADGRATDASQPNAAPPELSAGASVGSYTVLRSIGSGGMGTVFAAYDDKLDRKVALKVLHTPRKESSRLRVLREAQALAKLNHPNVVAVYATGERDEQLFIAMEFVDGLDLSAWRRRKRPDHTSVLEAYRQAGRGLAAAHAAELVHRDFKPGNAMIDAEGRVKVLDFGLARRASGEQSSEKREYVSASVLSSDDITRTGSTVGTPAYMSPEQMMGLPTDARTDQFSFCVSLWEALFGVRPFQGATAQELLQNTAAGKVPPPANPGDAAWTVPILERGLSNDPDARWPDMEALLAALEPERPQSRTGAWWAISAVVAVGVAVTWRSSEETVAPCNDGEHAIATTWNADRRDRVRSVLAQSDRPYADAVSKNAAKVLDGYATAWAKAHASACIDARDNGQSPELRAARYACLDRAKQRYGLLVQAFEDSGADSLDRVPRALASLPTLSRCADVDHVLASVPPPASAEDAERVATLRERLHQLQTYLTMGQLEQAQATLEALDTAVAEVDYAPIRAAINLEGVRLAAEVEDGAAGLQRAEAAYLDVHGLDPATVIETHLQLSRAHHLSEQYEASARELRVATALVERWMPSDTVLRIRLLKAAGVQATGRGEWGKARAAFDAAFNLTVERYGPESIHAAEAHLHLGLALKEVGELDEALLNTQRARDIWMRTYGPRHPDVARAVNNTATMLRELGNNEEALKALKRARDIFAAAHGEHELSTLMTRLNIAVVSLVLERFDEAEREIRAVLKSLEPRPSRFVRLQAVSHMHLGIIAMKKRDDEASRAALQRSVDLHRQIFGPDSIPEAEVVAHLGNLEAGAGNLEAALEHHQRSLRIHRSAELPNPADVADGESNVAGVLAGLGRCEDAWPLLESGLDYWTPRITPKSYFAEWLVTQHLIAALCADQLGKDDDAARYALRTTELELANPTDRFDAAQAVAAALLEDAPASTRERVVREARDVLEPAATHLMDAWLESTD